MVKRSSLADMTNETPNLPIFPQGKTPLTLPSTAQSSQHYRQLCACAPWTYYRKEHMIGAKVKRSCGVGFWRRNSRTLGANLINNSSNKPREPSVRCVLGQLYTFSFRAAFKTLDSDLFVPARKYLGRFGFLISRCYHLP